jgi:LCP family protein required for cell wall assembly
MNTVNEDRPPRLWWGMWKRFLVAAVAIVALSAGATATIAQNEVDQLAEEVLPASSHINAPKGLVTPEYSGGPETFLILGSDRREHSKDVYDKSDPAHSDTILLVRFDPSQGQTSVLSIPRDLLVNIHLANGTVYEHEKINAAYTYGYKAGGTRGAMLAAAETIKKEVFPELTLNAIVDVNFRGFIQVVDTLGCVYVNVDHHYYNLNVGTTETDYTSINLYPGYQKLCYENALNYVRYRHTDSDFVRVARQQDFIRNLREQVSAKSLEDILGQIHTVAKAVGKAIKSTVAREGPELVKLAKLIVFSQSKPLRQVKFLTSDVNAQIAGGSYVTSNAELESKTLNTFLHGHEELQVPSAPAKPAHHHGKKSSSHTAAPAHPFGLYPTTQTGENEAVKASTNLPFKVLYPALQTGAAQQQEVRSYVLPDQSKRKHWAYVVVWQDNTIGGYYDFEGTNWLNPPLFAHSHSRLINGRRYLLVNDGSHIHVIGWRDGKVLYWVTNTLLEDLTNQQMLAIARSARGLH